MRTFVILTVAALVGAFVGWQVGNSKVPSGGELETAVYPMMGAGVGLVIGVGLAVAVIAAARSSRGRNDL